MAEESRVKVYGMWASAYVFRVKLALKIKGVEYEYIEEDLANKSEQMLQYNPVTKKVPVLVHNGLPLAESLVILEYIDETWTNTPYLLPKDSYQRAKHRFWAAYFQQVSVCFLDVNCSINIMCLVTRVNEPIQLMFKLMTEAPKFIKYSIMRYNCGSSTSILRTYQ